MFSLDLLLQISTKHDLFSLSMFLLHFFFKLIYFCLDVTYHSDPSNNSNDDSMFFFSISWTHPVWFSPMKFSYCTEFKLRSTIWWISQDHNVLIIFSGLTRKMKKINCWLSCESSSARWLIKWFCTFVFDVPETNYKIHSQKIVQLHDQRSWTIWNCFSNVYFCNGF